MRLKITFKTIPGFKLPYNNNYTIATVIYNALEDTHFATELHDSRGFKYFTFSQVQIPQLKIQPDGLVTKDGKFQVQVSSVNEEFIKNLWYGLFSNPKIDFQGVQAEVEKAEIMKTPKFTENMKFKTLSPIYLRTERDGKTWDLGPGEPEFKERLNENLFKKYWSYYKNHDHLYLDFKPLKGTVKQKRIIIKKDNIEIYHRSNQMKFELTGPEKLLEFAWQVGLGEKTSMGFGMVDMA
jgi:CRISPR-associated endoribonuclease Cas6